VGLDNCKLYFRVNRFNFNFLRMKIIRNHNKNILSDTWNYVKNNSAIKIAFWILVVSGGIFLLFYKPTGKEPYFILGQTSTSTTYTSGSGQWVAPTGITSIKVELWGGGGAGGGGDDSTAGGGGGGGGAYSIDNVLTVVPGVSYAYTVGAAGASTTAAGGAGATTTFATTSVIASGGLGGSSYAVGTSKGARGGWASTSVGDTKYNGGTGATGTASVGGGGGAAAGTSTAGASTVNGTGAVGTAGGGSGGDGGASHDNGLAGVQPGGGGGGAGHKSGGAETGGGGANGKIVITYYNQEPPSVVNNTASGTAFTVNTPTLEFTGTDPVYADEVEYEIQVDTSAGFDSIAGSFSVNKINVRMGYNGSPTDGVYVRVYSDTGSTLLGTSNTVPYTSITSGGSNNDFTFTTPFQLSGTTKYYFSVYRTGARDDTNYFKAFTSASNVYADGGTYSISDGSWGSEGTSIDYAFIVYDAASGAIVTQSSYGINASNIYGVGSFEGVGQSFTTPAAASTPLLDKLSSTESPTYFSGTGDPHPWPSGNKISYAVSTPLSNGTYYYRVRGIDPLGSNTYGEWASTSMFTVSVSAGVNQNPAGWFQCRAGKCDFQSGKTQIYYLIDKKRVWV
jgi:hypothetical protein